MRSVVATKWASIYIYITTEVTALAIKVARDPWRGKGGQRERARTGEKEKCCNARDDIEENGYIIYIGLKELHKNVWSTKKDDDTVAAPRDSTRLIVKITSPVYPIRNTKDRQRTDRES